jgi:septum formation protein
MSVRTVILASGSSSRRAMLEAAGVCFTVIPPEVDEGAIKDRLMGEGADATAIADALAHAKAVAVSPRYPDALVIGADQILISGDRLFDKASDAASARRTLQSLRGADHSLISVAVLAIGGNVVWRRREAATLQMREFSDAFLDAYLEAELPDILGSVGCYRIEGRGAQLFEWIVGDQFCIRGLPLVFVLEALRKYGGLQA